MTITIDKKKCKLCGVCIDTCPVDALSIENGEVVCDVEKCLDCQSCEYLCEHGAISFV